MEPLAKQVHKKMGPWILHTSMLQTIDMLFPSMTSRYMDVGDTFGIQANSVGASDLIGSLMSRGGLWHLGSTEFGTVKFCNQWCNASRWQSQCHLFWWSVKSLKQKNGIGESLLLSRWNPLKMKSQSYVTLAKFQLSTYRISSPSRESLVPLSKVDHFQIKTRF